MADADIYQQVQERYSSAAKTNDEDYGRDVATAFGYSREELASIPEDANLGLSCGNPLALAQLREGEVVIDLGSGAGIDAFLSAKNVGPNGHVYGIDMNKDMLARAKQNAQKTSTKNVSFIESQITSIPLQASIADCIISNCVVNLVPDADKPLVFQEMARLLKPGGRVAISDILTKKDLPRGLKESMALYVGCVAGASRVSEYERFLKEAGFADVLIVDAKNDLNIYTSALGEVEGESNGAGCCAQVKKATSCCAPDQKAESSDAGCCASVKKQASCCGPDQTAPKEGGSGIFSESFKNEFKDIDFNEWAGSFKIYAVKK
ncbi:hypothetical protein FQN51_002542 [Onygenales sp. PD_10]|nr:hypothetical protein FQN51_002542 [Onygenales sp. PD_10]